MLPKVFVTAAVALGMALSATAAPTELESTLEVRASNPYPGFKKLKYVFSFGDSYTQTGFNITNGSPLPAPGNPMGNPPWPGWTAANGPNWIGYLTTKYNASTLLTYNFAYGGATIDSALVAPWRDTVLSLKNQVEDLFLAHIAPKPPTTPWKSNNSLFTFFIGINDIGNSFWLGDFDNFHTQLLDVYFGLIEKLYAAGARNFLFINVPPIERSPLIVGQGEWSITTEKEAILSYNTKLAARVAALKADPTKKNSPVFAKVFDSNTLFNTIIDNGAPYGLKNTTEFCVAYEDGTPAWDTYYPECGVPVNDYFWFNNLHPGYKVNDAMAKAIAKFLR